MDSRFPSLSPVYSLSWSCFWKGSNTFRRKHFVWVGTSGDACKFSTGQEILRDVEGKFSSDLKESLDAD